MRAVLAASLTLLAALAASCTTVVKKEAPGSSSGGDGSSSGGRPSEPCEPGNVTTPIDAFDVSPSAEGGTTCDPQNVLDDDGNIGGVASAGPASHKIVGREVNGCVGVEFGENIVLASLIMKMRPTAGMCGHTCTEGGSDGCGTGWKVAIFVGPSLERLQFLQQLSLTTPDFFEYRVAVHRSYEARFAVVCREPTPPTGDDIAIDAIAGLCGDPPGQ